MCLCLTADGGAPPPSGRLQGAGERGGGGRRRALDKHGKSGAGGCHCCGCWSVYLLMLVAHVIILPQIHQELDGRRFEATDDCDTAQTRCEC